MAIARELGTDVYRMERGESLHTEVHEELDDLRRALADAPPEVQ